MRTRNALERLAAVAPAEPLVDSAEQERILERIVTSDRPVVRRRRPVALVLVGVAVLAAAATVASLELGHGNRVDTGNANGRHVPLTGAKIQMAGYHFRTPAGFKATPDSPCSEAGPNPAVNGFNAAASAHGGCVYVGFVIPGSSGSPAPIPSDAEQVDVGSYQGYYVPPADSGGSSLYVDLPKADPAADRPVYLLLSAQGLTEDQLIAVAASGLPDVNFGPSTTTGTEGG